MKAKLLVGVDFSEGSAVAIGEARRLAARLACDVDVVHVTDGREWRSGDAETWLARSGVEPEQVKVRSGVPWVELTRHAAETSPLMLVVGSHGRSGFHPLGVGSTAARLGAASPIPVLVVSVGRSKLAESEANGDARENAAERPGSGTGPGF